MERQALKLPKPSASSGRRAVRIIPLEAKKVVLPYRQQAGGHPGVPQPGGVPGIDVMHPGRGRNVFPRRSEHIERHARSAKDIRERRPQSIPGPRAITIEEYRARQRHRPRVVAPPPPPKHIRGGRRKKLAAARARAHLNLSTETDPHKRHALRQELASYRGLRKL